MFLNSTISQSPPHPQPISLSLSSSTLHSPINFPSGFRNSSLKRAQFAPLIVRNCSISKVTAGPEMKQRTPVAWKAIYKRISMMGSREKGSASVLNQWENEGKAVSNWELCRLVKELRKYGRYKLALEVYEWMNKKPERFIMSTSDTAIHLDLISKVHGLSQAEHYFENLPNALIDKRVYGSLLNAYAHAKTQQKAESLLLEMKAKNFASHPLPYNVMMTLYMNLNDHQKVESLVSEMMQENIDLDLYSYSIWLTSRGSQGSVEKIEEVFEKMKRDASVSPNWTTFSTMAAIFIKLGELKKAEDCLKKIENKISGKNRVPYHYLLSHYGSIGKKNEVKRIWETYKTTFSYIPNMGYDAVILAFIKMDDIEEAENLYEEWMLAKSTYDARLGNRLLGWYVRNGQSEKMETFFKEMIENGKANSSTWEIVAEDRVRQKRVLDAFFCFEKALLHEESSFWKPKPGTVLSFLKVCDEEHDERSKEALMNLLREKGVLEDESFAFLEERECDEREEAGMILNEGSLF